MEKLLKTIIWIVSFFCFYAIMHIGLGKFHPLGKVNNPEQMNNILINLSYSYVAGLIFYLLVSYLPNKLRSNKFKPIIRRKIKDLYNQVNGCVVTFHSKNDKDIIKDITPENLEKLINENSMYAVSFYGKTTGIPMDNFFFLNTSRGNVFVLIQSLLQYRDYMTDKEVSYIESINDSSYFHLIKNYETTERMRGMYDSESFKKELSKELYHVIELIRKLKKK